MTRLDWISFGCFVVALALLAWHAKGICLMVRDAVRYATNYYHLACAVHEDEREAEKKEIREQGGER